MGYRECGEFTGEKNINAYTNAHKRDMIIFLENAEVFVTEELKR